MKMTTWSMSVTLAQALDPGVDAMAASPPHPERSDPANPAAPVAAPIFISSRRVILVGCMGVSVPSSYLDADSTTGSRLGRGLIGLPQGGPGARVESLGHWKLNPFGRRRGGWSYRTLKSARPRSPTRD